MAFCHKENALALALEHSKRTAQAKEDYERELAHVILVSAQAAKQEQEEKDAQLARDLAEQEQEELDQRVRQQRDERKHSEHDREQKERQEQKKTVHVSKNVITEEGFQPIPILMFQDGSIAGHTFVSERKPTYFEAFTYGGLCFIVALFMKNIDFFGSMRIVSPHALLTHLERNRVDVNFKSNRMLESDDITKIADFLKVRIPVKSINMGVLANIFLEEEVLGGSRVELGAVTLDMMGGQGGGHYIVEGLN
jgi:flagellar biosynthesis GTPase FlhF